MIRNSDIQPIHPFPARMAPSIVWENLPNNDTSLRVLDPMAGSGTTLVHARAKGHQAVGCDTDPLAMLIATAWCSNVNPDNFRNKGKIVLEKAKKLAGEIQLDDAYPAYVDEETRNFINFWFDDTNRVQLTALSHCISHISDPIEKALLWCAFSRLIITKTRGVSLAMDVSHSRPHRKYEKAPIHPFDKYLSAIEYIIKKSPFLSGNIEVPSAILQRGDARNLPIDDNSIDLVITSPPYLNAIDYMRGHKLSLVWMGYCIKSLRSVRTDNIGSERSLDTEQNHDLVTAYERMGEIEKLERRHQGIVMRYVRDMNKVFFECRRVMRRSAQAVFVVGDSAIKGVFVRNSEGLIQLGKENGLTILSKKTRPIPDNRRYLPPPKKQGANNQIHNRMREEVILTFSLQ